MNESLPMFMIQVLWGFILLLIGYILKGIREDMAIHTADIKMLTTQLLAQYVPQSVCQLQVKDKWEAIEDMEKRVQIMKEDVAVIKDRLKLRRSDNGTNRETT